MAEVDSSLVPPPNGEEFRSGLALGRQRFLAHVIEHGLSHGRRTPEDFIRHFPPDLIMEGLKLRPQLRSNILVIATGIKPKIARKKSWESSAEDLQIALDEEEADAETVVTLFAPDDRVRYLDDAQLWAYVTEGAFWEETDGLDFEIAKGHIAFMMDRALLDDLLSHEDIVHGIGVSTLAELLPRTELEKILAATLRQAKEQRAFDETDVMHHVPSTTLVEHIPLGHIWDLVMEPLAVKHDFSVPLAKPTGDLEIPAVVRAATEPKPLRPTARPDAIPIGSVADEQEKTVA